MKLHRVTSATSSRHKLISRSMPVRLGTLAVAVLFTATQMPAQRAPATTQQATTEQSSAARQSSSQLPATSGTAVANPDAVSSASSKAEMNALPEAPAAQSETSESASLNMSPELKAMMDDASQSAENLEPTVKPKSKAVQRPGMLVLGIAGVPLIVLGAMIFSLNVGTNGKATGLRNGLGTAFLAPGAAMSGFGFYFAFHKKNQ